MVIGGHITAWNFSLTGENFHLWQERWRVHSFVRFLLFCFAFIGLAAGVLAIVIGISHGNFNAYNILFAQGLLPQLFWLSLVASLLVYQSLDRELARIVRIPSRVYETQKNLPGQPTDGKLVTSTPSINIADTLTNEARRALADAFTISQRLEHPFQPTHLFLSCLKSPRVGFLLARLGVAPLDLYRKTARAIMHSPAPIEFPGVFFQAYEWSYRERRHAVDLPFLFAAVATLDPVAQEVLRDSDIDGAMVENVLAWLLAEEVRTERRRQFSASARLRPRHRIDRAMTAIATPALDYFSEDITEQAQYGAFPTPISRPDVLDGVLRVFQSGRNVLISGYPGVGKMGVIEELAQRMVADEVPPSLKDKRLVAVSIPKLVSGASSAEAGGRLQTLLLEAARAGNVVLVFTEIQSMIGMTSGTTDSVDLATVLMKGLQEYRLRCLATTTPDEYRRMLTMGGAVTNVFESLTLDEPTIDETIRIVEGRVGRVEAQRRVFFSYDSIQRLVTLAAKYLPDYRLPKKALQQIDELALWVLERRGRNAIIGVDDVNAFLEQKLSIRVSKVGTAESQLLLDLEKELHKRIIGQDEAVGAVSQALRRARAEVRDQRRPVANFLFLGPTGVGKTELAKAVAAVYFGDEHRLIRFDMSEYQELRSISRLIGDAAGGRGEGQLTAAVRANPFALVLFDELEKAHPDILNLFLQLLDEGRLTDSRGQTTDFTNTIIIATSNAGTEYVQQQISAGTPLQAIERQLVTGGLSAYFRPEFLNRFDRIVLFKPLSMSDVTEVTRLLVQEVTNRLSAKGIIVEVTDEAIDEIAKLGFDPLYGARPLRRVIQDELDSVLARELLAGRLARRDRITFNRSGQFQIEKAADLAA